MRGREDGVSLPELLVAALLIGIALVPLLQLYPGTLGFNVETEIDTILSAAAVRKTEELIGALRAPGTSTVAFDAVSSAVISVAGTSLSWTHTPVGTPSLAVVGVTIRKNASVTALTYGGTAMTFIRQDTSGNATTELWRLINPPTGAQTVSVTISAAQNFAGGAITFTGSDTTTPISNHAGATGISTTPSVTVTSASGELVVDAVSLRSGTIPWTVGAGQTLRWERAFSAAFGGSTEPGAASVTMSWTNSVSGGWAISAASVKAAGAAVASGNAACTDLPDCRLVWTIATELSGATAGTLTTVQVVACQDTNANSACDAGERQARYDAKVTSRP